MEFYKKGDFSNFLLELDQFINEENGFIEVFNLLNVIQLIRDSSEISIEIF